MCYAVWLVLAVIFVTDAIVTLLTRMARGERGHEAHRSHGRAGRRDPCWCRQDAAAQAAALEKLIGDAALRRCMGGQSRMLAETEFGQETVIAQTLAVYREACA